MDDENDSVESWMGEQVTVTITAERRHIMALNGTLNFGIAMLNNRVDNPGDRPEPVVETERAILMIAQHARDEFIEGLGGRAVLESKHPGKPGSHGTHISTEDIQEDIEIEFTDAADEESDE